MSIETKGNVKAEGAVSLCILTCRRDELLLPLLHALQRQLGPEDEVIVLDTGDSDATRTLIKTAVLPQVRYYPFPMDQFNFATARNQLLSLANNEFVAFIDDDAVPFPHWVERLKVQLSIMEASGGATVANGELPDWWDPAINWCVGLSPPGTVLGFPGFYPDTCNMAARHELWRRFPFQVVQREGRQLYATGREDAEWWMQRRLDGASVGISYRQAVTHQVHRDRLTLAYIKRRARNDGVSSWLRRPSRRSTTDIPWDLAHITAVVIAKTLTHPFDLRNRLADSIWMQRQWGKFLAVWNAPLDLRPRHREQVVQLAKAMIFQLRIRLQTQAISVKKTLKPLLPFPAENPRNIFVSADCFLGDSLLLRRHVSNLGETFPQATIWVSCRFPFLFSNLGTNVIALPTAEATAAVRSGKAPIDTAIIPYYAFGDTDLWRDVLSANGVTFNCDVGFAGQHDALYARQVVSKNMEVHEHENLCRLFRLWPQPIAAVPPPPAIPAEDIAAADATLKATGLPECYITVQIGSGHCSKSWPAEYWIDFFRSFLPQVQLPVILLGDAHSEDSARQIEQQCRQITPTENAQVYSLCGGSAGRLLELVRRSAFFIGACSGPKHAAMAFDVPTFTLYSASEPVRWGATENHPLHGYATALPQKLSGMELQEVDDSHRPRLLRPDAVAQAALRHYRQVMPRG